MVHKVWDKDTSDSEVGSIREHLVKSYKSIFMDPPACDIPVEQSIAENLIEYRDFSNFSSLTSNMTLAELTSLEQLISIMVTQGEFNLSVLNVLWLIFGNFSKLMISF